MIRIVSESTQAIVLCSADDPSRKVRHLNAAFQRLTGHDESATVGRTLPELLRPTGGQLEWEHVEKLFAGEKPWRKTLPAARADNTVFWADLHVYPIGSDKRPTHWVCTITDVTDRLELYEALRRSEAQYRILAENVRDLITVISPDGRCLYASPSSRTMLGFSPEELVSRPLYFALPPSDRSVAKRILEGHRRGLSESSFCHSIRRKDGTYLWAETISKTYSKGGNEVAEIVSVTRDISKRRDTQEKLAAAHGLLETIYRTVPIGLCLVNAAGSVIQCNAAFAQALAAPAETLMGRAIDSLLPAIALGKASVAPQKHVECECVDAHGNSFSAEISLVDFDPNSIAKRLVTLINLKERKDIEAKRREVNQLESLGTLAGGIAHDFNNKLAIILAYASLLRDASHDPARIAHYADTIMEAGRRGADVVRQLQLFANTHEAEVTSVNLHELLEHVLVECSANWPKSVELRRNFSTPDSVLTADPFQLAQAVKKLIDNALEAMPSGGTLTIATAEMRQAVFGPTGLGEQKNFLRISVEDTGVGMDASTRSRIFEPFFSHGKHPTAAGVGLAVVYGIMRAHHGSIEVDSAPGQGTRVHLLFPRAETNTRPVAQIPFEFFGSSLERKSILLVEDEQDIGALWQELLPADGWRVLWARDGSEALRLFNAHREEIALVFTDIGLPGIDGWEIATGIRSEMPGMPLLFASGAFRRGDRKRGFAQPVAYLSKPYVPSKVLKVIRGLVPA
jgi:PAS domain S-box-containing protein